MKSEDYSYRNVNLLSCLTLDLQRFSKKTTDFELKGSKANFNQSNIHLFIWLKIAAVSA